VSKVRRARGPGRVNLIGDHTDYNQGVALPMAIGLGAEVSFTASADPVIVVESTAFPERVSVPLDTDPLGTVPLDPTPPGNRPAIEVAAAGPAWSWLIAAMIALCRPPSGGILRIESTVPVGSGLSSSAAVAVAVCEVLTSRWPTEKVARTCQQAEHLIGVPVGIMDPLVCAGGRAGRALLIDFSTLSSHEVVLPREVEVIVVDSGVPRTLAASGYAARVAECRSAAQVIGPLGLASEGAVGRLGDPLLQRRARHVISECRRTRQCAVALSEGHLEVAGELMVESHQSLARDFEVSTLLLDQLVETLVGLPGVLGARMTGAGFGGTVVVLARRGAVDLAAIPGRVWPVEPVDGTVAARR
jgi:galactokinase